ncbi:hypothetical protein Q5752_003959 [Cryptotrichosporon argae]
MSKLSIASTVKLNTGRTIPQLGFGVYQARGDECKNAVIEAIHAGYTHIDSAQAYHNEHHVGAAVAASGVPRASLFLTTKFMPGHSVPSVETVYAELEKSRPKLAKDGAPIDLMLIHSPRPNAEARAKHWEALAKAQSEGWIKDIGVSNFGVKHLAALPAPTPAINQIELHPWCQQRDIVAYCQQHSIAVQAYCPIVRADPKRLGDPVAVRIADKHGKQVTQVLIRWSLQKGYIPLPKSVTSSRIKANADVYDFELDADDMAALDGLDEGAAGACSWNPVDTP